MPTFDDTPDWWYDPTSTASTGAHPGRYQPGWYSVNVPKTGTTMRVADDTGDGVLIVKVRRRLK